jgi:hypothetical protein
MMTAWYKTFSLFSAPGVPSEMYMSFIPVWFERFADCTLVTCYGDRQIWLGANASRLDLNEFGKYWLPPVEFGSPERVLFVSAGLD